MNKSIEIVCLQAYQFPLSVPPCISDSYYVCKMIISSKGGNTSHTVHIMYHNTVISHKYFLILSSLCSNLEIIKKLSRHLKPVKAELFPHIIDQESIRELVSIKSYPFPEDNFFIFHSLYRFFFFHFCLKKVLNGSF